MDEIWDIEVGYVTSRRGARLHLSVDGRPHCKSGSGGIIQSRKATGGDAEHVCKRCRKALRARLVDVHNIRSRRTDRGSAAIVSSCDALLDGLMTPAERAELDAMIDDIRRHLAAQHLAAITPKPIHMTTPMESDELTLF